MGNYTVPHGYSSAQLGSHVGTQAETVSVPQYPPWLTQPFHLPGEVVPVLPYHGVIWVSDQCRVSHLRVMYHGTYSRVVLFMA